MSSEEKQNKKRRLKRIEFPVSRPKVRVRTPRMAAVVGYVYIVRHGETEENKRGIVQGQMDTVLNAEGLEQAKEVGRVLEKVPFDLAYSSDLSRAAQTAEIILGYHPDVKLHKDAALRERYMGDMQGKMLAEVSKIPSNAENLGDFAFRAVTWWKRSILQRAISGATAAAPRRILVVSHGGLIGGGLVAPLVNSRKLRCAPGVKVGKCFNASVTVIEVNERGECTLVQYSDVSHLIRKVVETNADVME